MISNLGIFKLMLDVSRVPLIDTHTLKPKVDKKLLNDPIYLTVTNLMNNIVFITPEDLILGRINDKYKYKEEARLFINRSEDMKDLIEQQRKKRR